MISKTKSGISRHLVVFGHDIVWVPVTIVMSYWLRVSFSEIPPARLLELSQISIVAVLTHGATFWLFGCYRGIWRFASIPDLVRLFKAVLTGAIGTTVICFMIGRLQDIPRTVLAVYPMILMGALCTARIAYRILKDKSSAAFAHGASRALLVGAGRAGEMLVRDMQRHTQMYPVAFVDDDVNKYGQEVRGVRIRGGIKDIPTLIDELSIEVVLITMPSASRKALEQVVKLCGEHGVKCRTLPSLAELADGRIEVARLRPVTVEDLLGRDKVELDPTFVDNFIQGKRVLVTGGGGSIGSELCRQIGGHKPAVLTILDNSEFNLYKIDQELGTTCPSLIFNSVLGDVRDSTLIEALFKRYQPQVVFHAAAYKHVPIVEDNIIQGIRNNVFGTKVVADASKNHGVEAFVLISTDKTVNPTNVMGTTKRAAELYCQALNEPGRTHFITTRFGNVLASAGSVVPLFEKQIARGGPVTVTHPDITRYFMTIPEAASLILQAGAIGRGGEIFVLDMGEPVRIFELAERMIHLSGLQPGSDIEIVFTGLRPGEKLHEELFYAEEELRSTVHPKLLLTVGQPVVPEHVFSRLERLERVLSAFDQESALSELQSLVPEFKPAVSVEDRQRKHVGRILHAVK